MLDDEALKEIAIKAIKENPWSSGIDFEVTGINLFIDDYVGISYEYPSLSKPFYGKLGLVINRQTGLYFFRNMFSLTWNDDIARGFVSDFENGIYDKHGIKLIDDEPEQLEIKEPANLTFCERVERFFKKCLKRKVS